MRRPVNSDIMPLFHFHRAVAFTCILVPCCFASSVWGQSERIGAYQFRASKDNHSARVVIRNAPFDSSRHSVGYNESVGPLVDGRKAYGAEGVPRTQIKSISFYFDGRRVNVPRPLFADCYDPNLEPERVKLRFSRDLQVVFVTMLGSDGAGGYIVVWRLRRNGRHTRSFKPAF